MSRGIVRLQRGFIQRTTGPSAFHKFSLCAGWIIFLLISIGTSISYFPKACVTVNTEWKLMKGVIIKGYTQNYFPGLILVCTLYLLRRQVLCVECNYEKKMKFPFLFSIDERLLEASMSNEAEPNLNHTKINV